MSARAKWARISPLEVHDLALSLCPGFSLCLSLSSFQSSFCLTLFIPSLLPSPVSISIIYGSNILACLPALSLPFRWTALFPSFASVSVLLSSRWLKKHQEEEVEVETLFPHQIKKYSHGLY